MASAAQRFHIVLTSDEKRGWSDRAASIGVSTAEYIRRAVSAFDDALDDSDAAELDAVAVQVAESAARMRVMIDDACALVDRPLDEDGMRARAAARLAAHPVVFDASILDFCGGATAA